MGRVDAAASVAGAATAVEVSEEVVDDEESPTVDELPELDESVGGGVGVVGAAELESPDWDRLIAWNWTPELARHALELDQEARLLAVGRDGLPEHHQAAIVDPERAARLLPGGHLLLRVAQRRLKLGHLVSEASMPHPASGSRSRARSQRATPRTRGTRGRPARCASRCAPVVRDHRARRGATAGASAARARRLRLRLRRGLVCTRGRRRGRDRRFRGSRGRRGGRLRAVERRDDLEGRDEVA